MSTLDEVVDRARSRLESASAPIYVLYTAALQELDTAVGQGALTRVDVLQAVAHVEVSAPSLQEGNVLTGIVLQAARRLEAKRVAEIAAMSHVRNIESLVSQHGDMLHSLVRLLDDALSVAVQFDLQADDALLVARLRWFRAFALMGEPPTWAEGLNLALRTLTDLGKIAPSSHEQAAQNLLDEADAATAWAKSNAASQEGGAEVSRIMFAALAVYEDLDCTTEAHELRIALLHHLLQIQALDDASPLALNLEKFADADPTVAVLLADLDAQLLSFEDALDRIDHLPLAFSDDPHLFAQAQAIRANSLRALGSFEEARATTENVLDLINQLASAVPVLPLRRLRAHTQMLHGQNLAACNQIEAADAVFSSVLAEFPDLDATEDMLITLPTIAAQTFWNAGENARAARWLRIAAKEFEEASERRSDATERARFREQKGELTTRSARALGLAGRHRKALLAAEASKGVVLRELMLQARSREVPIDPFLMKTVTEGVVEAKQTIADAGRDLERMARGDPARRVTAEKVVRAQDRRVELLGLLEGRLATRLPVEDTLTLTDEDRLNALIASDTAVISFSIGADGLSMSGVGPGGQAGAYKMAPTLERFNSDVLAPLASARTARHTGEGEARWNASLSSALSRLWDAYGEDVLRIAESVGGSNVALVPHRSMHGLPLGAATAPDGSTLTDHIGTLSILPALGLYDPRRRQQSGTVRSLFVERADRNAPLMAAEAALLASRYPERDSLTLSADAATPRSVAESIVGADLAHFAVHGTYRPGNPRLSGLALAPPLDGFEPFDTASGLLNVTALATLLPIRSLRLAVLSACDSALGEWSLSDDRSGFPGILLGLGVQWVVASHWQVDDLTTLALMHRLYSGEEFKRPAAALASAVNWLRTSSPTEIVGKLRGVPWPQLDDYTQRSLDGALAKMERQSGCIGPNGWAAFSAYGAPIPRRNHG